MVLLTVDKNSTEPLFKQIVKQIIDKVENSTLNSGDRLPATRKLAEMLSVNRATVFKAYQELWALGYIESKSGSYSYIRDRKEIRTEKCICKKSSINWEEIINPRAEEVYKYHKSVFYPFAHSDINNETIDLAQLHPDNRLYPVNDFKKSFNYAVHNMGEKFMDYGNNKGFTPLREFISQRMKLHGILTGSDETLITNGAQNGIDLLLKLLTKKNSRVFVESPTYSMILTALRLYDCEVVPIKMTDTGVDLKQFENEINKGKPAFFYTMTNCHNPTGITTSQEHREKLLDICERQNIPIVEDAFEEEMKYFGHATMPIKSMDTNNQVIYIGSFSKILFPGIRLGWISGPEEVIDRLTIIKRASDLNSPMPIQAALYQFCINGFYELHIKRLNKIYKKRMQHTLNLLDSLSIPNVSWLEPSGGYTVWVTLENLFHSYEEIDEVFLKFKIKLALGRDFFTFPIQKRFVRLSIARLNEDEISIGIERFKKALEYLYSLKRRKNE